MTAPRSSRCTTALPLISREQPRIPMPPAFPRRQSITSWGLGDGRFRQVMTDAVTILEGLGASPELVEAMALDAAMSAPLGDLGRAIGSANRAISLAAELGLPASATAIGQRGAARSSLGDR